MHKLIPAIADHVTEILTGVMKSVRAKLHKHSYIKFYLQDLKHKCEESCVKPFVVFKEAAGTMIKLPWLMSVTVSKEKFKNVNENLSYVQSKEEGVFLCSKL